MTLLAKRTSPGGKPKTLLDHTFDVVDAATALFGEQGRVTRLGESWLRFFRMHESDAPAFHANLLAACLFHDWGKANDDMQQMLAGRGDGQSFRHEHLSVLMLGCDGVDRWVRRRADIDWDVVLASVGSHHLRFTDQDFAADDASDNPVRMRFDDEAFHGELVPQIARRLGIDGVPVLPRERCWGFVDDESVFDPTELRDRLRNGRLRRLSDRSDVRMLHAVRAALIVADAAGSGLPRTGRRVEWIREQFNGVPLCDEKTIEGMIAARIAELTRGGKWERWNEFQDIAATLPERSLLLAPCGSGKTLAAWRWIAARVAERPVQRVLFLYPTRATATEGFKDYVSWAPECDAALVHGTAGYDLDGMFDAEDPRRERNFAPVDPRLFALQHWSKRVFSATVDQFLAFLAYGYGPMCLLPLLADSVIAVDEVHSFDRKVFSALLGFLEAFDVPVLCMTATLPAPRRRQLSEAGLTVADPRPEDLRQIAEAPRYRVQRVDEATAGNRVREAVRDGHRVLWVVNQVSRAQNRAVAIATLLADWNIDVVCYHSRFTLDDRRNRHRETVDAIRAGKPPAVAVTTQVCEMSLDIDADLLVTEDCPITSLIQRMGRCRRGRDEFKCKGPGDVLIYRPDREHVYARDDLDGLDDFLTFLVQRGTVSQTDLESGLSRFGPTTAEAPRASSFLASGAYADGREDEFRDIDAHHVQAVLDADAYLQAKPESRPGLVLPVPVKKSIPLAVDARLPRHLRVAPQTHYHWRTGFWDEPLR